MAAPSMSEVVNTVIAARARAWHDPAQRPLVDALGDFVILTAPFVRAEMSAPEMVDAFNAGLAAMAGAGKQKDAA